MLSERAMRLDDDTRRRLCRARDVLELVDNNSMPIPEIARRAGVSPFHFIRIFEATFGATPHQYRIRARLDRAKQLLALGQHSVTEACMEVGFSSVGSFSSLFAQRIGETPSGYRRRVRTLVQVPGRMPPLLIPGCFSLLGMLSADAFRNLREAPPPGLT